MRFTAFAFSTLAATALATPVAKSYVEESSPADSVPSSAPSAPAVGSETYEASPADAARQDEEDVEDVVPEEVTSVVAQQPGATDAASPIDGEGDYKTVQNCEEVIALLEEHVEKMEGRTGSIGMFQPETAVLLSVN